MFYKTGKIFILVILLMISCSKKEESLNKDFKKIDNLIYNKKYNDAEKYINSLLFMKNDKLKKIENKTLRYKLAKLNYIYLNKRGEAYLQFQKLSKESNHKDLEILEYLADLSRTIKISDEKKWLEKMFEISKDNKIKKAYSYRYAKLLKSKKEFNKLKKILDTPNLFDKNDLQFKFFKIDLERSNGDDKALVLIEKYLKDVKNDKDFDKLLLKKIFISEDQEDMKFEDILKMLDLFKTDIYSDIIEQKRSYYNEKLNLLKK